MHTETKPIVGLVDPSVLNDKTIWTGIYNNNLIKAYAWFPQNYKYMNFVYKQMMKCRLYITFLQINPGMCDEGREDKDGMPSVHY